MSVMSCFIRDGPNDVPAYVCAFDVMVYQSALLLPVRDLSGSVLRTKNIFCHYGISFIWA